MSRIQDPPLLLKANLKQLRLPTMLAEFEKLAREAAFPVHKDFDTFDFTAIPSLSKQKVLELARGEWIDQHFNSCLIGDTGTGKTHLAIALGLAACCQGRRVRFFTAASLVNRLEETQKQY